MKQNERYKMILAAASLRYGLEKLRVMDEKYNYVELAGKTKMLLKRFKDARTNYIQANIKKDEYSQKQIDSLSHYAFNLDREENERIGTNIFIREVKKVSQKTLEQILKVA